jgi:ABC-type transporter Mla subunit MlaD
MGSDYENALATLRRTSTALASARSELARMQAEASVNYFEQNQAYLNTKTKVEKLTGQLNDLSSSLDSLSAKNSEAMAALDNSAIGKPSIPVSVPPERIRARNALVIGGVIGIGFAWLVLNRRWLIRRMSAATEQNREEA